MILYNTTFCVDNSVSTEFLNFLKFHYIPSATVEGLHDALVLSMRGGNDADNNTQTVALQMRAPSETILENFHSQKLPLIYGEIFKRWGNGVAMFESTLDILHDSGK